MEIPITNMTHHWTCSNQKVTKQHYEACVFYLRDIQKIHLEYILRKHTQLYMYIGVGLWDKLKCIFFLSKNKRQKLKQGI